MFTYSFAFNFIIVSGMIINNTPHKYIAMSIKSPVPEMKFRCCAISHKAPIPKTIALFINIDFLLFKIAFKPQLRLNAHKKSGK